MHRAIVLFIFITIFIASHLCVADEVNQVQIGDSLGIVYFAWDQLSIPKDQIPNLEHAAVVLNSNPQINLLLAGHTDERGTNEYNLVLGEKMATVVREYLSSLGVDQTRLSVISHGEADPLDPGHCQESWDRNRRVELIVEEAYGSDGLLKKTD